MPTRKGPASPGEGKLHFYLQVTALSEKTQDTETETIMKDTREEIILSCWTP